MLSRYRSGSSLVGPSNTAGLIASSVQNTSQSRCRYLHLTSERKRENMTRNLYDVLGVGHDASGNDVKSAYYKLSKQYHPDTSTHDTELASKKFQEISYAYEVLGNPHKRSTYDRELGYERSGSVDPDLRGYPRHRNPFRQEFSRDFDMDYQNFVEFQRQWRRNQRMARQSHTPPEFSGESWRNFESFYRRERPKAQKPFTSGQGWYYSDDPAWQEIQKRIRKNYQQKAQEAKQEHTANDRYYNPQYREPPFPDDFELRQRYMRQQERQLKEAMGSSLIFSLTIFIAFLLLLTPGHVRRRQTREWTDPRDRPGAF